MKRVFFIFILLLVATQGISQTEEELLREIARLEAEKKAALEKEVKLDAMFAKIRQAQEKKKQIKKSIAKFAVQENRPAYQLENVKQTASKTLSTTSKEVSKVTNIMDSPYFKALLSEMNNAAPNNQTIKDAKDNASKVSQNLKDANFGVQLIHALFDDKQSRAAVKSETLSKLKIKGEEFLKSIPTKGSAAYTLLSSEIAHLKIADNIKEFYMKYKNRLEDVAESTTNTIFNNKGRAVINNNKYENDTRKDASRTVKRSTEIYLKK
jgi:hypothetical protein